jgi:hypothetical protein
MTSLLRSFAVLLAFSLPLLAQEKPAATSSHADYTIAGTVVSSRDGSVVHHCRLELSYANEQGVFGDAQPAQVDDNGHFIFEHLRAGNYRLVASARDFITSAYEAHGSLFTGIVTGPEQQTESIVFKMTPKAMISGHVYDEAGDPVRRAQVRLQQSNSEEGTQIRQAGNSTTDDLGRYEFPDLGAGKYKIMVSAHPWYVQNRGFVPAPATNSTPVDPALDVVYPITYYPVATDPRDAAEIVIKGGERFEANFNLMPEPSLHVTINLPAGMANPQSNAGNARRGGVDQPEMNMPNPNMPNIMLQPVTPGMQMGGNEMPQIQRRPDGSFEVSGIAPGQYRVTVMGNNRGGDPNNNQNNQIVTLTANSRTLDLTSSRVETEVTVSFSGETGTQQSGRQMEPTVELIDVATKVPYMARPEMRGFSGPNQNTDTPERRNPTIRVPPGVYTVVCTNTRGSFIAHIAATGAELQGRKLTVGSKPVQLTITMATGLGNAVGFVTSADKAASGELVLLVPQNSEIVEGVPRRDQSNSDGSYGFRNVIPGNYLLLSIHDAWEINTDDAAALSYYLKTATLITIRGNETEKQDIALQPR